MKKKFFILIIYLFTLNLSAQIKVHKNISTADGLINNEVQAIWQDSNGYLWIATMGGISRWDGYNFTSYSQNTGLPFFQTFDICETPDSSIYFATFGRSIIKFKDDVIDTIDADDGFNSKFIMRIFSLPNGEIIFSGADASLTKLKNNKYDLWDLGLKKKSTIYDMVLNNDEVLFIATHDLGLGILENDTIKYIDASNGLNSNLVWDLNLLPNGDILIATNKGVNLYSKGNVYTTTKYGNTINADVFKILVSTDSSIYYGSSNGVYVENESEIFLINTQNGLSDQVVMNLYETKNGEILIALKSKGFDIYQPNKLMKVYPDKLNQKITAILKDSKGKFHFGTRKGLLIEHYGNFKYLTKSNGLNSNNINSLAESSDGKIYIGTEDNGVTILENGMTKSLTVDDGLIDNRVSNIKFSPDGKLYVTTFRGISIYENKTFTNLNIRQGLLSNFITDICFANDGNTYFTSHGKGISILKDDKFTYLTAENGLSSNAINNIFQSSDGKILIGTDQGGLNVISFGIIDIITTGQGLLSNQIRGITEDNLGNIIVSTPKGLNIIKFIDRNFTIRSITTEDGLIDNDCSLNSIFCDELNNTWIGTSSGVTVYNSTYDKPKKIAPLTYINGLEIFNNPMSINEFIQNPVLKYNENYLKLHFIGIDISSPHKTVYQYKLSGVDKDWVKSKNNSVQYTSLDDGDYTFEVKAVNEWGFWSEPAKLNFVIKPAWWETWWFYTIAFLSIGTIIAFVTSYRYRHLLAIEKVRTKISEDLHDSIGSGLTEITFLSEMVKSQVKENEYANKGLNNISGISKTLIDDMRDIVWLVNPNKDTLQDLFNRLQDSYQEALKFSKIQLIVNGIEDLTKISLPISYRQNIFLMFKEAINNSIKYGECNKVEVNVKTDGRKLSVELTDDGKGFNIENTKLGNGIKNIKKRAQLVNGKVDIITAEGEGTKILFEGKFNKLKISEV